MKYLKTYEALQSSRKYLHDLKDELHIVNKIPMRYYERNDKGKDTGFSILINFNEREILINDNLIQIEKIEPTNTNRYSNKTFFYQKERKTILDKLELMRAAEKYNM